MLTDKGTKVLKKLAGMQGKLLVCVLLAVGIVLLGLGFLADGLMSRAPQAKSRIKTPGGRVALVNDPYLKAMCEDSLKPEHNPKGAEVYRFLYTPSFAHPVLVRLNVKPDGSGAITVKNLSGKGGYELGKMRKVPNQIEVPAEDVRAFRALLEEKKFRAMPEEEPSALDFLDGTGWYFEALHNGRYHAVHQDSSDSLGLLGEEANKVRVLTSLWLDSFTIYDMDSYLAKHGHEYKYKEFGKQLGIDMCDYLRNRNNLVIIADKLLNMTGYTIQTWGDYEESMKDHETFSKESLAEAAKSRKERQLQHAPEKTEPEELKEQHLFQVQHITLTLRNPDPEGQLQVEEARLSVGLPPRSPGSYPGSTHGFGVSGQSKPAS